MRSVAKGRLVRLLAGTKVQRPACLRLVLLWHKGRSFVAAIAKGLPLRLPAGAPPIATVSLNIDRDGRLLRDMTLCRHCRDLL